MHEPGSDTRSRPGSNDQRELIATKNALHSLVNALPSPAFIVDRAGVFLMCNEALARSLGQPVAAILGHEVTELLPRKLAQARLEKIGKAFATGAAITFDDERQGRVFQNHVYPVFDDRGEVDRVAVFAVDVSEVRRAEGELRASEERMRATIDGTPDVAVQWYDLQGRVRLWNRASERMFGFSAEEAMGRTLDQLIHTPEEQAGFMASVAEVTSTGRAIGPVELTFKRRGGTSGTCLSTIFAIPGADGAPFAVCMDVDLTERKRVEAELRQAQKEEVLGRLAGGMAHDFNNLLTAIVGFAELGRNLVPGDSEAAECLRYILESAQRGAALTGNLLAFARKRVVAPRTIALREVVDRLMPLMRPLIGENIELVTRHDQSPDLVHVDVGSIEQVIMNLVINARDALPAGGRIVVQTRVVTLGPGQPVRSAEGRPELRIPDGRYVELSVADTGTGVPPEVQANVFEPFFTTKGMGEGTGLGLATSAGIVRQAGGFIGFESNPDEGATFRVHLPVAPGPRGTPPAPQAPRERPGGTETVLVVEDDVSLRRLVAHVLGLLGYRVLTAEHGRDALEVAARHEGRIDLLLSDVIMPEMGGIELADALRAVRPETRVLLISGYTTDPDAATRHSGILAKPFSPSILARRVRDVLDA